MWFSSQGLVKINEFLLIDDQSRSVICVLLSGYSGAGLSVDVAGRMERQSQP